MRTIPLLLAAALIVSVPVVATVTTDTYAATSKKNKPVRTAKVEPAAKKGGGDTEYDFNKDPNTAFLRALGDLFSGKSAARGGPKDGAAKGGAARPAAATAAGGGAAAE
jgi:hypothetical protein